MRWSFFVKPEKTKPSDPKGWVAGPMLSLEWEATVNWIKAQVAKLKRK